MQLREAYDVLEIDPGAAEDAVKDARNTLAKVWHPDKHANDPELQKKAQIKLAEVNEAYEAVKRAGFPKAGAKPKAEGTPPPTSGPTPPKAEPKASPKSAPPPKAEPPTVANIELVPKRRVRWSVILLLVAAVGVGAYFALVKLGSSKPTPGAVVVQTDAAAAIDPGSNGAGSDGAGSAAVGSSGAGSDGADGSAGTPPSTGKTFGLGSTHEDVLAAQGKPARKDTVIDETWYFGFSQVTFNKRGKVSGWWDTDDILNVKLTPADDSVADYAKKRGGFAMGASKDEVIGAQGTPKRIDHVIDETWYYGTASSVSFNGTGKVTGYHNINNELSILQE